MSDQDRKLKLQKTIRGGKPYGAFRRWIRKQMEESDYGRIVQKQGGDFSVWNNTPVANADFHNPSRKLVFDDQTTDSQIPPLTDFSQVGTSRGTRTFPGQPPSIASPPVAKGGNQPPKLVPGKPMIPPDEGCWELKTCSDSYFDGYCNCEFEFVPLDGQYSWSVPIKFIAPTAGGFITTQDACLHMFRKLKPDYRVCRSSFWDVK